VREPDSSIQTPSTVPVLMYHLRLLWQRPVDSRLTRSLYPLLLNKTDNPEAKKFLESIIRLSAIDTYRSSFIEGIRKGIKSDGLLHANFNQCITATGRLSSSNPNLQNFPKGKLFPVRKAFVSRFDGGQLIEIDYSQLEFRVAGILARDPKIKQEVESGFDVHAYTAQVLTDNGEPTETWAS
jgi:DNA polymerase I-like protein with 3'-5' exonuclease and polymerase domains